MKPDLQALRLAKGWTQAQLAEAARVSAMTVSICEKKNRLPHHPMLAQSYAKALGITLSTPGSHPHSSKPKKA